MHNMYMGKRTQIESKDRVLYLANPLSAVLSTGYYVS
jgi:hypothetical protein